MRKAAVCLIMALVAVVSDLATDLSMNRPTARAIATTRLEGADRFATAVEVARHAGGGSLRGLHRLIVVTGSNTPDALVAAGLAGYYDRCTPHPDEDCGRTAILLTRPDELPPVTADAIAESGLSADEVVIIGGVQAVAESVRDEVARAARWEGWGPNPVVRLAGEDRYTTARIVAEHVRGDARARGVTLETTAERAVVVSGDPQGQDLLAGAQAYREGRLVEFSRRRGASPDSGGRPGVNDVVIVATSSPLDAAVAATLGRDAVIVLTERDRLGTAASGWISEHRGRVGSLTIVGGTTAVDTAVEVTAVGLATPPPLPPPPPVPLTLSYPSSVFTTGQVSQTVAPVISGDAGSPTFQVTGALPPGVTFSTTTGAFTGPAVWSEEATQVATGFFHSCAVTVGGRVRCWGSGSFGRLGRGSNANSPVPGEVIKPGSVTLTEVTQVATGTQHSCALIVTGTVKCWGSASSGQIGRGTTSDSWTAIDVVLAVGGPVLGDITQIAAGERHTCGLRHDGTVACWGANGSGRLGDGTTTNRPSPVDVLVAPAGPSLSGVTAITAGSDHTCALMVDTTVRCWGAGGRGQLGDGLGAASTSPVTVSGLSHVTHLAAGSEFSCAIRTDTTVACWGANATGELGDGTTSTRTTPVDVVTALGGASLSGVVQISTGDSHACARLVDGEVVCWGAGTYGRLGDGAMTTRLTPVSVTDISTATVSAATDVAAGGNHGCLVRADRVPMCWGRDSGGQLGDGVTGPDRSWAETASGFTANTGWPTTVTVTVTDGSRTVATSVVLTRT